MYHRMAHNDIVSDRRQLVQDLLKRKDLLKIGLTDSDKNIASHRKATSLLTCPGIRRPFVSCAQSPWGWQQAPGRLYHPGLIETSNCRNNCYYHGIRKGNIQVERYRLSRLDSRLLPTGDINSDSITFVLQGGEDHGTIFPTGSRGLWRPSEGEFRLLCHHAVFGRENHARGV